MISEADIAAVLRKAAQGLRDPEQVVLDPLHLFEDANGGEAEEDEGPCRACAVGHIVWATVGTVSPIEVEIAVTDALGSHSTPSMRSRSVEGLTTLLADEGAATVAALYERVADELEAAECVQSPTGAS
jgi:hypothetical protein